MESFRAFVCMQDAFNQDTVAVISTVSFQSTLHSVETALVFEIEWKHCAVSKIQNSDDMRQCEFL